MTDFVIHHRDHASVLLDGDLDWPKVHDLVHAIETAVEFYLYGLVEIRVRSAGGSNEPLRHILERLRVWREQGVRFQTRAVGRTSSAAALLVALGDERVVDPGVPLLFHGASMYRRGDLTAAECGALHSKLLKANERIISRLVDRAIAGPLIEVEHGAEPSDREVAEALCVGAAPDPGGTAPARVQTLATALGQTVDEAVRERDRKTLAHIYQRLFEIDRPVSGKLARTLRLVDRVGTPDAGARGNLDHLSITVPASPGLYLSADGLPREALLRHVLVLGDDTGAATRLCLAPVVAALARAGRGEVGSVLVLNPDSSLRSVLESVAGDRLLVLDADSLVLDLMSDRPSLASALKAGQWMTAATHIVERTLALIPGSPAQVLLDVSGKVIEPVVREGLSLALSVVGFVLMLVAPEWLRPEDWCPDEAFDDEICQDLIARARGHDGDPGPNVLALASWLLGVVPGLLPAHSARAAADAFARLGSQEREVERGLSDASYALSGNDGHDRAVLAVAQAVVAPFSSPATRTSLYFGCEPGLEQRDALDLAALVSGVGEARFIVHTPRENSAGGLVATALKHLFFEAVHDPVARAPGGTPPPHCGYIARNFERYATEADRVFLERGQSAGVFAVLASRSVTSIEHALGELPRGEALSHALLAATGTKLLFRSTDHRTQELARRLPPCRPNLANVLDVRPVSGLGPDEAYVSRPDGRFERWRLARWPGSAPENVTPEARPKVLYLGLPPSTMPQGEPA